MFYFVLSISMRFVTSKIINEIDPKAFVTISEDQEIDGGFEKRL
ncbi:MAG: DUF2179 domain-containing protein [Holdemanella porci]